MELVYREEVRQLLDWCVTNYLSLNVVCKIKEILVDLKRNCPNLTPLYIKEKHVERLMTDSVVSQEHIVPEGAHHRKADLHPKHLISSQESLAAVTLPAMDEESTPPPPAVMTSCISTAMLKSL